ncbi:MAG: hypothetical protein J5647_11480 [Spirochaetaceae bacterium]|nr:hypothetical protein [Spirochaetaceae bacterium]
MKHLKKIVTIIGILCLTNTLNAADDFFEFVVVDEPEEILIEESAEEVISDTTAVTEADEAAEEDTETGMSAVVPMVSGKAVTAESATAPETAGSVSAATAPATPAASFAPAATSANTASSAASTTTSTSAGNTRNASTSSTSNVSAEANVENAGEMESTVYEPEAEAEDDEIEETPVDEKAPSRSVTIKKRQYLDVTYPGEGWLFMGDEYNSKALSFKGREQKGNSTLMKFYSDRAGEALLHFCKQDILTDTYIHDYLLVTVDKTTGNRQHIEAPEYIPAPAVNKDADIADIGEEQLEEETEETEVSEVAEVSEQEENEDEESESEINSIGGISLADEPDVVFSFGDGIDFSDGGDDDYYQQLIDEANDAFFAGRGQEAVEKAQIVIDDGSYFSDEALYIQAQVYETDQALLDVNKAYGLYKTIVDYYPESSLWSKASKRVTYLERYYYSIR